MNKWIKIRYKSKKKGNEQNYRMKLSIYVSFVQMFERERNDWNIANFFFPGFTDTTSFFFGVKIK